MGLRGFKKGADAGSDEETLPSPPDLLGRHGPSDGDYVRRVKGTAYGNASKEAFKRGADAGSNEETLPSPRRFLGRHYPHAADVGILQSTILPSFGLHSGLAIIAYAAARSADRLEYKDWLWPAAPVANAWWSAVGIPVVYYGASASDALGSLTWDEKLLLTGVTVWGGRLLYRIASRSARRPGDDPRYEEKKKEPGFWNKALLTTFLPEAAFQTLISLPFTLPFRLGQTKDCLVAPPEHAGWIRALAIALFGAGFALEVLADYQVEKHHEQGFDDLNRDGVWSIVRHPNYLGDAHVHASFPLLLYSAGLLHPLALLGPAANYVFLRHVGGDAETEASQEERYKTQDPYKYSQLESYRAEKNAFWPALKELGNKWYWAVLSAGAGAVVLEKGVREMLR